MDTKKKNIEELDGSWAMFNDRHPDGWGNWDKPYLYLEFNRDGTYKRTYIHRKNNSLIFGKYKVIGDSLIAFFDSKATNGTHIGEVLADTAKLIALVDGELELHEHWYTIWTKRKKPWRHKKKFRLASKSELQKLGEQNSKLLNSYWSIKDTVNNDN